MSIMRCLECERNVDTNFHEDYPHPTEPNERICKSCHESFKSGEIVKRNITWQTPGDNTVYHLPNDAIVTLEGNSGKAKLYIDLKGALIADYRGLRSYPTYNP